MTPSKIVLHTIHVAKNGDIVFRGSPELAEAFRAAELELRKSAPDLTPFDVLQAGPGVFRATPDNRNPMEAHLLARHFLAVFQRSVAFEEAFPTQSEFTDWYLFNRRQPTLTDLRKRLASRGVVLADPKLPFASASFKFFQRAEKPEPAEQPSAPTVQRKFVRTADGKITLRIGPSVDKLNALAERFSH